MVDIIAARRRRRLAATLAQLAPPATAAAPPGPPPAANFVGGGPLLNAVDHAFWEREGYLVVPDAVPLALCDALISEMLGFLGLPTRAAAAEPGALQGVPGRVGGTTQSQAMWDIRQSPKLHAIFAALLGTHQLWVSQDAWDVKPPFASRASDDPDGTRLRFEGGGVFEGEGDARNRDGAMHFDLTRRRDFEAMLDEGARGHVAWRPQAVVYLNDRTEHGGGLRLVPGFHRERAQQWLASVPADVSDGAMAGPWRFARGQPALADCNACAINVRATCVAYDILYIVCRTVRCVFETANACHCLHVCHDNVCDACRCLPRRARW